MFDAFAGALEYFGGSFRGATSGVLACARRAFANVGGCVDRMKRH
jgi:hypothetical protein